MEYCRLTAEGHLKGADLKWPSYYVFLEKNSVSSKITFTLDHPRIPAQFLLTVHVFYFSVA